MTQWVSTEVNLNYVSIYYSEKSFKCVVYVYIYVYECTCLYLCLHLYLQNFMWSQTHKYLYFWYEDERWKILEKKKQLGNVFSYLLYNCCFLYLLPGLPKFISLTFISPNVLRWRFYFRERLKSLLYKFWNTIKFLRFKKRLYIIKRKTIV